MCDTCGCGAPTEAHDHDHDHDDEEKRRIEVRQNVLSRNDAYAAANRKRLAGLRTLAFNLISSPGAGKTTLLEGIIRRLDDIPLAVIEGDLQTERDAERIRNTGVDVHQINTGEGCHLDAHMVGHAMDHLSLPSGGILFIENVGNLVCPAGFDLGESLRVVVLSIAEGDDKVEKYPVAFKHADVMVINKVDLMEHVDFSIERCREIATKLNPELIVFEVSARTGSGMEELCQWLRSKLDRG